MARNTVMEGYILCKILLRNRQNGADSIGINVPKIYRDRFKNTKNVWFLATQHGIDVYTEQPENTRFAFKRAFTVTLRDRKNERAIITIPSQLAKNFGLKRGIFVKVGTLDGSSLQAVFSIQKYKPIDERIAEIVANADTNSMLKTLLKKVDEVAETVLTIARDQQTNLRR